MTIDAEPVATADEGLSRGDALKAAAEAFKNSLSASAKEDEGDTLRHAGEGRHPDPGQRLPPQAVRITARLDPGLRRGDAEEDDQIEASDAGGESADGAESQLEEQDDDGAAETAQPGADLPSSWPAEQEALWRSLPPEAQAVIAGREGQRDAAVNAKFQEAANAKKAAEAKAAAEIETAELSRRRYIEAVDQVLSLVVPQSPPRSMLDAGSPDYDPDRYHYQKALHEETLAFLNGHATQRRQIAAQAEQAKFTALNEATRDAFIASVPDIADQAKAPALFQALIDYAQGLGTPAEIFDAPTSALEWHILWKAREYDRLQAAKAKVSAEPKPEPRKPQPAVRPGVATPRAAIEQQRRGAALDRLRQEGSVEAGAAAIKQLMRRVGA